MSICTVPVPGTPGTLEAPLRSRGAAVTAGAADPRPDRTTWPTVPISRGEATRMT
ncbi:hypothetical protein [Streptomyces sp. NBC_01727]|uniref:hypothetical protein n=1 Tax=unclassified Streptomyces TaxID=2593676 RepID=UPI002E11F57B|nr:hypothetical protein OIE76_39715 [Streptomyces sp. NBC_01727]